MKKNSYSVKFNDNDISLVEGVFLTYYNATDLPERDINIHKLARRSKSIITSSEYTQKTISVRLWVCGHERQATEAILTTVKGLLQPQNGELVVEQSGILVRYTATMNEFNIEWDAQNAFVDILFIASTPIATSLDTSVLANMSTTLSSASVTFTVGGSAVSEPTITVVINSVTGGTGTINLFNAGTNQGIAITDTFADGDIIEVDSLEMSVTHNGQEMDFVGIFPTFVPGSQQLSYSDTFTTRSVDIALEAPTQIV